MPPVHFPAELYPEYPLGAWRDVTRVEQTVDETYPAEIDLDGQIVYASRPRTILADVPGPLLTLVNLSPEHSLEGSHRFETYTGDPGQYQPIRDAHPDEDGYLDRAAARKLYTGQRDEDRANRKRVRRELLALAKQATANGHDDEAERLTLSAEDFA